MSSSALVTATAAREPILMGAWLKPGAHVNAVGSVLTPFFTDRPVRSYADATSAKTDQYGAFFRGMLDRGVYPPPSQFEAWFISSAHTLKDVDKTIAAARGAMKAL